MAKSSKTPLCFQCGAKKAKVLDLPVSRKQPGSEVKYQTRSPFFCSLLCAGNWALDNIVNHTEDWHWCSTMNRWEPWSQDMCKFNTEEQNACR